MIVVLFVILSHYLTYKNDTIILVFVRTKRKKGGENLSKEIYKIVHKSLNGWNFHSHMNVIIHTN